MSIVSPVPAAAQRHLEPQGLTLQSRPHRVGVLHLSQLLLVEAIVLGVAAVAGGGAVPTIVLGVIGLLLSAFIFLRRRHRWVAEWQLLRWRLARRTGVAGEAHPDARVTALRTFAPGLDVVGQETADGNLAGIGGDQAGWFAAIECQVLGEYLTQEAPGPPLDRIAQVLAESEIPGLRAQVLTHTVSPPVVTQRAQTLGAPAFSPAEVDTWVVLRLDAEELAQEARSAELSPPDVLMTLVRRTENLLKRSTRASWRVLDAEDLTAVLARSCGLSGAAVPVEELCQVRIGSLQHVTFWVRSWPRSGEPQLLLDALSLVPATFTSVSIVLEPDGKQTRIRCLVRIAAGANDLDAAVNTVHQVAQQLEADLMRLDAEQGPALYATVPSGGGIV